MTKLPSQLIDSLSRLPNFNKEKFIISHDAAEKITSIRINPYKYSDFVNKDEPVPWCSTGYYLNKRPSFTFDPLFHAGCYYVQEASGMFLEQAFLSIDKSAPIRVLDLCAAPGGKSTHLLSLLGENDFLLSNEVVRSRIPVLCNNIAKWGCANFAVSNNDPKDFAALNGFFDAIVIDAPCSGSGLFRKDEEAIKEWSVNNVNLCSGRQKRILSDVLPALKSNGVLIYSTCSFSEEENEAIAKWLIDENNCEEIKINTSNSWGIEASEYGYRFYPYNLKGEGFYMACFRKKADTKALKHKPASIKWSKIFTPLDSFIERPDYFMYFKQHEEWIAVPKQHTLTVEILLQTLNIKKVGLHIGKIIKEELIPAHDLALSNYCAATLPKLQLNYNNSIKYLRKEVPANTTASKGWTLAAYNNCNLGWCKVLHNRINNYFPSELRILSSHNPIQ